MEMTSGKTAALRIVPDAAPPWLDPGEAVVCYIPETLPPAARREPVATFETAGGTYVAAYRCGEKTVVNFNVDRAIRDALCERYMPRLRPKHVYASLARRCLPGQARLEAHRVLAAFASRAGEGPDFPAWPIEKSVETLRYLAALAEQRSASPVWPRGKRFAVCFTHDVDTARGFAAIRRFATLEERYGIRSCWFVAFGAYPIDFGLLRALREAGHEIGLHGVSHDERLPYWPCEKIEKAINSCREFMERCNVEGFRAPSLLTTPMLDSVLARHFAYDSSVPDTDMYTLIGHRRGCCTTRPFAKHSMIEIPLTLPLEDKLMILGYGPQRILSLWNRKLAWVERVGGVAMVSTHVEPHLGASAPMRRMYEALIERWTDNKAAWLATPAEIARWWHEHNPQ